MKFWISSEMISPLALIICTMAGLLFCMFEVNAPYIYLWVKRNAESIIDAAMAICFIFIIIGLVNNF